MPETTNPDATTIRSGTAGTAGDPTGGAAAEVRALVDAWANAVATCELDGVTARHTGDVVMFDVPPPEEGNRGIDAYRASWPQFFDHLRPGGHFDLLEVDVTAGEDVAFVWALLRCGSDAVVAAEPDRRLRLTIGLRREAGEWRIAHEHHSFTDRT